MKVKTLEALAKSGALRGRRVLIRSILLLLFVVHV